jgi:hypothetical protein
LIQLDYEGPVRVLYRIGSALAPRWVWLVAFLLADLWFIYYLAYLGFSVLGLLVRHVY